MTYVPQQKTNLIIAAAAMGTAGAGVPALPVTRRFAPRLRRVSRRSLVLALLVAAVPVTVTATVVQLTDDPPPREAVLPTLGAGPDGHVVARDPLPALPATLSAAYGRLGRPATAADRDDDAIRKLAANASQFGLAADQARVMATIDGQRVWLVPGNGFLCIGVIAVGDHHLSSGCETEAVALKDGLSISNDDAIYGLLPDGVSQVDVTDDTGFHHVESVVGNVYVLPPVSATVRYRVGTSGTVSFRVVG